MDAPASLNEYLQSFMDEIEALDDNATVEPAAATTSATAAVTTPVSKKRRRIPAKPKEVKSQKPGWVPKPSDDCPVVSWLENGHLYAVQNPANSGSMLLKMELYDGVDMVYMCGLYLDKDGEIHQNVKHLVNQLENMWIDKSSGVPKINGLTQTVTQRSVVSSSQPKVKKQAVRRKRTAASHK